MTSKDERKLARTIVDLERRLNASRAKQLPFTSVALDDGTEQGIADGVAAGRDAYHIAAEHDGTLTDIGDISDASAVESTFLPERLAIVDGSADAAFDLSLIAAGRVGEALTAANEAAAAAAGVSELAEGARTAANAAQTVAEAASTSAAQAKAEAEQASADATSKAAAAEAAAKEYATAQAAAAESAAKAAASDDATAKAQAAEDAAKLAAAADAKAKADAAQAAAEAKAASAQSTAVGAASAAADATARANAVRELALQNTRYRQVDGGNIEPAEPEGGFRINAQRVKVNASGQPYQIDRWSGTGWVRDQVLADQILVPDENGTVAIGNARIVAPTVIGGEFFGNRFEGSELTLSSVTSMSQVLYDNCEVVGTWERYDGSAVLTRTAAQKKAGSYSMLGYPSVGSTGAKYGTRRFTQVAFPRGGRMTVWVYVTVAASVAAGVEYSETRVSVPANTWTELVYSIPAGTVADKAYVHSFASGNLYIDELRIVAYDALSGVAAITREIDGSASVKSVGANGDAVRLTDGRLELETAFGQASLRTERISSSPRTRLSFVSPVAGEQSPMAYMAASESSVSFLAISSPTSPGTGRQTGLSLTLDKATMYGDTEFLGSVKFQGDTDWASLPISGGTGTMEWRIYLGEVKFRFSLGLTNSLAVGAVIQGISTLPAAAVPAVPTPFLVNVNSTYGGSGIAHSGGRIDIRNTGTVTAASVAGSGSWFR
ncbi:hypothetical protein [Leucobacter sp. NPDC077196]|uniref:hypothetical protein n=1 Tax=Leucobacter sp. NPDC077196 TaxID=3154959 RepID=UPI00341FB720